MGEECKRKLVEFWQEHPGKTVGLVVGFAAGCSILLFGFWQILFVVACVLGGLYIGAKFDGGNEFLHHLTRALPEKFQRW